MRLLIMGGTLFIGVNDEGRILGLENDMTILNKDFDKLQRTIVQKIIILSKTPERRYITHLRLRRKKTKSLS